MTEDSKVLIPPFKIQGIKSKLVPMIRANVKFTKDTIWVEPFMGSAVVGLNVAPRNAIFADINPHIVNFYNQLKSKTITADIVKDFLNENGLLLSEKGGEHYYYIRERFNSKYCPLDFLFLNRSCFNGMIRFNKKNGFNVPYCQKPNRFAKAYITKIVNQVKHFEVALKENNWEFVCQSFETTINNSGSNSFIYCDPPYIGRHIDYYDRWGLEQENALKECLVTSGARFMLSSWQATRHRENQYIDTMWGNFNKITSEHFYYVGATESNRNTVTEALLMNYS